MYSFPTRRERDYKEVDSCLRKKRCAERTPSFGDSSSADTLVNDNLEPYYGSSRRDEKALRLSAGGEISDDDVRDDMSLSDSASDPPTLEEEYVIEPTGSGIAQRSSSEAYKGVESGPSAGVRQIVKETSAANVATTVVQTAQIPAAGSQEKPIVSQEVSGRTLQRNGATTISQSITLPTQNWTMPANSKNKQHDSCLQSSQYLHCSSSDESDDDNSDLNSRISARKVIKERAFPNSEPAFKKRFGFGFEAFSLNPFSKPSLVVNSSLNDADTQVIEKFNIWLLSSPFQIWVTKVGDNPPYAICKFDNCRRKFTFQGNSTSFNIAKHLKRQHEADYELYQKILRRSQRTLESSSSASSNHEGPSGLTKRLLQFLSVHKLTLSQLNVFIEGFIPFSLVESHAMGVFLKSLNTSDCPTLLSSEELVSLLREYEIELNNQLKHTMSYSSNFNILIDMWTSSSQKSYLAVLVSFCPNVNGNLRLRKVDVTTRGKCDTHLLDFIDLSDQRHAGDYLKTALLACLSKYAISHKVGSITLSIGSNNTSILENLDSDLELGFSNSGVRRVVKIRCMTHVLNQVFADLFQRIEERYSSLLSRIDKLADLIKSNIHIREKIRAYIPCLIPRRNQTRSLSRYRQLEVFLKVWKGAKEFFLESRFDHDYQLTPDHCSTFCYEQKEIETVTFVLRLTRIFEELTTLLQGEATCSLINGIEYYMNLGQYYDFVEKLLSGSEDIQLLKNLGLKPTHLPSKEIRDKILGFFLSSRPKFEKYRTIAYNEPGYWVAHILQPYLKADRLNRVFEKSFRDEVLELAEKYVTNYCKLFSETFESSHDNKAAASKVNYSQNRKSKYMEIMSQYFDRNSGNDDSLVQDEWQLYLREPAEKGQFYVDYWLTNQGRFPALSSLALSFYNTKLSTADVERCFSVSRRVLDSRFSLASANLRSTMMIRNRLKCFNLSSEMHVAEDIPIESWIVDEEDNGSWNDGFMESNNAHDVELSSSDGSDNE
ncbi:putative transposase of the Rover1 hAT-like family [Lachancea mirantina]|uniref:Putative transposase of the Rover1 hAT-like family n=1 Tax=Lachancea mirantina TaxID=1230905 RepID=A0A1G4KC89_9SACH|nr:putative transposase of the Rover1 hAT-like family [Lachancea mirantina]